MATYFYFGYATTDIVDLNGGTLSAGDTFRLSNTWEAGLLDFEIRDQNSDLTWSGDSNTDESPDDGSQQNLTVTDAGGATVASGRAYLEQRITFTDEFGNTVNLYLVEINGTEVGYVADAPFQPGNTYTVTSITDVTTANEPTYASLNDPTYDVDAANTITGTSLGDDLFGGAGADTINAGGGDDTVDGGTGADSITGGTGNDSLTGGTGADTIAGGTGDDTIVLGSDGEIDTVVFAGGDGNDTITGFDGPIDNGDGTFTGQDQLSLSGLLDAGGQDVRANDVTVSDDGSGNAVITFPSGETITLIGIAPADISDPEALEAIGFLPGANYSVEGSAGADLIDGSYVGDPEGDLIDFNDALDGSNDDVVLAFGGDDTVLAGLGADSIEGGAGNDSLSGGDGDDTIWGESDGFVAPSPTPGPENLSWIAQGAAGTDLTGGFTQDTGDMSVSVAWTNDGNGTAFSTSTTTQFVGGGEPMSTGSAGLLEGTGVGATSTTTISFASDPASGISNEVQNIQFRINDVDTSGWQDIITVLAYDADGNAVPVTLTASGDETITGDTITAGPAADAAADANGSVLVDIAGPVQSVEIVYSNGGTAGQALWVTDIHFETVAETNYDDSIDGGAGADLIYGQDGDDTLLGGTGSDTIEGGVGADSIDGGADGDSLTGGAGADTILAGDADDTVLGGADGDSLLGQAGDDLISGEDGADILEGGAGSDTLSDGTGSDTVYGGDGADLIIAQEGADSLFGDADEDTIRILDTSATDTIDGGEGTTTGADQDRVDFSLLSTAVNVTFTGDEAGGFVSGSPSGQFTNIEELQLTAFDDSVDGSASSLPMTVLAGAGADTITGGSGGDSLFGDAGDDVITGGGGADILDGGGDADTFVFADGFGNDTVTGGETGSDSDTLDFSGVTTSGLNVTFTAGEDGTATGTDGSVSFAQIETATLTEQADTVDGSAATSGISVDAAGGDDNLTGSAFSDTLAGGDGADTLTGGEGDDSLSGGAGDDLFALTDGMGADTISDFDIGDTDGNGFYNDQLDVSGIFAPDGNEIRSYDITTEDDGFGNVRLVFPNGETLVLEGVSVAQMSSSAQLNAAGIPCFTPGTLIATPTGDVPVERITPGDLVITRDNGPQKVLWAARRTLGPQELAAAPWLKPVLVKGHPFGAEQDLLVSPQHGVLLAPRSDRADQRLVRAIHLAQLPDGVARVKDGARQVTYIHLLFEEHQVIFSNGLASESFYPGENVLGGLAAPELNELVSLFPTLMRGPVPEAYSDPARAYSRRHWLPESAADFMVV